MPTPRDANSNGPDESVAPVEAAAPVAVPLLPPLPAAATAAPANERGGIAAGRTLSPAAGGTPPPMTAPPVTEGKGDDGGSQASTGMGEEKAGDASPGTKKSKEAVVRRIVDEMEQKLTLLVNLPHGWLARKLREDPDCLEHRVNRDSIRTEEKRRKRQRESQLVASKEDNAQSRSTDEQGKVIKKVKKCQKSEATAEPVLDKLSDTAAISNESTEEGQPDAKNDNDRDRASLEGRGEKVCASKQKEPKGTSPTTEKKKRRPRRRKTFASGENKPQEILDAWNRLDEAEAGRDAIQAEVEERQGTLERLQREIEEARGRLRDYDATVVAAAKERVAEVEMGLDTPFMTHYRRLVVYKVRRQTNTPQVLIDDASAHCYFLRMNQQLHGEGALKALPSRCPEDRDLDTLCMWISRQRRRGKAIREGRMKPRRPHEIKLLEDLGFEWGNQKDKFEEHFDKLVAFKSHQGHCLVPQKYPDQKLSNWVQFLRQEMLESKRDGKELGKGPGPSLTPARVERLNALGFVWSVFELKWNERFDRLQAFRHEHGHCNVPADFGPDPGLAAWVARQREEYRLYQDPTERKKNRKCKLLPERIDKLNSLGFDWTEASDPPPLSEVSPAAIEVAPVTVEVAPATEVQV